MKRVIVRLFPYLFLTSSLCSGISVASNVLDLSKASIITSKSGVSKTSKLSQIIRGSKITVILNTPNLKTSSSLSLDRQTLLMAIPARIPKNKRLRILQVVDEGIAQKALMNKKSIVQFETFFTGLRGSVLSSKMSHNAKASYKNVLKDNQTKSSCSEDTILRFNKSLRSTSAQVHSHRTTITLSLESCR